MTTAAATEVDFAAGDLADAAVWDDGPPYALFARMQREEAIKQIINDVLDSVADRERFDLVGDIARPVPARVIGSMRGPRVGSTQCHDPGDDSAAAR